MESNMDILNMDILEKKLCYKLYLTNEGNLSFTTSQYGEVRKTQYTNKTSYSMINLKSDDSSDNLFFDTCPKISWEDDIQLFLLQTSFRQNKMINLSIQISIDKSDQSFMKDSKKSTVSGIETSINISFIYPIGSSFLTIYREHIVPKFLERDAVLNEIKTELMSINDDYGGFLTSTIKKVSIETYDIILPSGKGGVFVHEAIGHCLEADHFFLRQNVFSGKEGKRVTNKNISISDRCKAIDIINYSLSQDGTIPIDVKLVENGYLSSIMSDEYFSKLYGIVDTGNGRAMSCRDMPIPRMRNTYLHNGCTESAEIIRTTKKGVIATEIRGGSVNCANGNFLFNVSHGLVIEDGEIIGITEPFMYSGNVLDALNTIDVIGNDLSFVSAKCGKEGQQLTVAYGQPTLRISR